MFLKKVIQNNVFALIGLVTLHAWATPPPVPTVESRTYIGNRAHHDPGGALLFKAPLALRVEVDSARQEIHEILTGFPGEKGPLAVQKRIRETQTPGKFDVEILGELQGQGTLSTLESKGVGVASFLREGEMSWTWDLVTEPKKIRVLSHGRVTQTGLEIQGRVEDASGYILSTYSEIYQETTQEKYEQARLAILSEKGLPEVVLEALSLGIPPASTRDLEPDLPDMDLLPFVN